MTDPASVAGTGGFVGLQVDPGRFEARYLQAGAMGAMDHVADDLQGLDPEPGLQVAQHRGGDRRAGGVRPARAVRASSSGTGWPSAAATARHSACSAAMNASPPSAATTVPTLVRIRQVPAAKRPGSCT